MDHLVRNGEGLVFKQLQGQFLGEHDVSNRQWMCGQEAQLANRLAARIKLRDVHYVTVMNAVAPTAAATDHLEELIPLVLIALRGRKIAFEQVDCPLIPNPWSMTSDKAAPPAPKAGHAITWAVTWSSDQ